MFVVCYDINVWKKKISGTKWKERNTLAWKKKLRCWLWPVLFSVSFQIYNNYLEFVFYSMILRNVIKRMTSWSGAVYVPFGCRPKYTEPNLRIKHEMQSKNDKTKPDLTHRSVCGSANPKQHHVNVFNTRSKWNSLIVVVLLYYIFFFVLCRLGFVCLICVRCIIW